MLHKLYNTKNLINPNVKTLLSHCEWEGFLSILKESSNPQIRFMFLRELGNYRDLVRPTTTDSILSCSGHTESGSIQLAFKVFVLKRFSTVSPQSLRPKKVTSQSKSFLMRKIFYLPEHGTAQQQNQAGERLSVLLPSFSSHPLKFTMCSLCPVSTMMMIKNHILVSPVAKLVKGSRLFKPNDDVRSRRSKLICCSSTYELTSFHASFVRTLLLMNWK